MMMTWTLLVFFQLGENQRPTWVLFCNLLLIFLETHCTLTAKQHPDQWYKSKSKLSTTSSVDGMIDFWGFGGFGLARPEENLGNWTPEDSGRIQRHVRPVRLERKGGSMIYISSDGWPTFHPICLLQKTAKSLLTGATCRCICLWSKGRRPFRRWELNVGFRAAEMN